MALTSRPSRPAHRPSRRADIVEAAIRVFAGSGPRASMVSIAKEAGMNPTALYYHFSGKDELFTAAVEVIARRIEAATETRESAAHTPLRMLDAVETVWQWSEYHRSEAQVLYSWAASGPREARKIRGDFIDFYREKAILRIPVDDEHSALNATVARLAVRSYLTLAMAMSESWVSGQSIGDTTDRSEIVLTLALVSSRLTGAR
ncbi:hypothetical protein BH09ACT6_BH09ACT6_09050 [soil metagenome]